MSHDDLRSPHLVSFEPRVLTIERPDASSSGRTDFSDLDHRMVLKESADQAVVIAEFSIAPPGREQQQSCVLQSAACENEPARAEPQAVATKGRRLNAQDRARRAVES